MARFGIVIAATALLATVSAPARSAPGTAPTGSAPAGAPAPGAAPAGAAPEGPTPAPIVTQPTTPGGAPIVTQPTTPGGAPIVTQPTTPGVAPPGMQPRRPQGVMQHRWAIAIGLGAESMKAKQPVDSPTVGFGTLELAGRYRLIPAAELGLSLGGGGAFQGKFSSSALAIDFHYHFMAEQPMNIYLVAGLGVAGVYPKDNATDVQRKGRGMLRFGVGGELKFEALALFAEIRLFGIGENTQVPEAIPSTTAYELSRYGVSGAALVFGATYYF